MCVCVRGGGGNVCVGVSVCRKDHVCVCVCVYVWEGVVMCVCGCEYVMHVSVGVCRL